MTQEEIIEEMNKMKDEINKLCEVVKEYLEENFEIFDKIKSKVYYKENCDLEFAIENNPCICGHVEETKTRKNFFKKLDEESFDKLIIKSIKKPNKIKKIILLCLSKGKRMLKK